MSASSIAKLQVIHKDVLASFGENKTIGVTPVEGDPPNKYKVVYQINSIFKDENGAIQESAYHEVLINIPFGFPHFPPSCKPLTPIYHPDFDPSAICIGDFWKKSQSFVELIVYIGKMISGETYTTNNAFNSDAVQWYMDNSHRLPFAKATVPTSDHHQANNDGETADSNDNDDIEIDILDDADFDSEFNYLNPAQTKGLEEEDVEDAPAKTPLDSITPEPGTLTLESDEPADEIKTEPDLTNEEQAATSHGLEPERADVAEREEEQARLTFFDEKPSRSFKPVQLIGAFCLLGLVAFVIQFYLSLNSNMNRAQELLGLCGKSLQDARFTQAQSQCNQALESIAKVQIIRQNDKKALKAQISSILSSTKLREGLAGNILVDGQYLSKSNKPPKDDYNKLILSARHKMDQADWKGAIKDYQLSLKIADNLYSVDEKQVALTRKEIKLAQIRLLLQSGKDAMARGEWDKTTSFLNKGLELIKQNPGIQAEEQPLMKEMLVEANFYKFYDLSKKQMQQAKWPQALKHLKQALAIGGKSDRIQLDTIKQLKIDLNKVQLYLEIEKGKTAFTHEQWDKALGHYNHAIQFMELHRESFVHINPEQYNTRLSRIMLHIEVIRDKQETVHHLEKKQFDQASQKLASIIKSIKKSSFAKEKEFQTIIEESQQALVDADFQFLLATSKQHLQEHYKTIFSKHYPSSTPARLSKPKITYVEMINDELLFNLQCVEHQGGRPIRLILDYLYNPVTKTWSFYSDQ